MDTSNLDYQEEDYPYEHDADGRNLRFCWYCHGEGYGIIGVDWDCEDAINGPYDGEIERCPCCHGSGLSKDETFW